MIAFNYYLNVFILSMFCLNKIINRNVQGESLFRILIYLIYFTLKNKFKCQVIKFHANLDKALKKITWHIAGNKSLLNKVDNWAISVLKKIVCIYSYAHNQEW